MMPEHIAKWFAEPEYGNGWQDADLILAELEFLPSLISYLDNPAGVESKKLLVTAALLELLEHECPKDGGQQSAQLASKIKTIIRAHADIAQVALSSTMSPLGPVKKVVVCSILGLSIPEGYPQWVVDRANEQGA
jgi:hypothetical protein